MLDRTGISASLKRLKETTCLRLKTCTTRFSDLSGWNESTNTREPHGRGGVWMITWMAIVGSRDRPREGARSAQETYRGGPEGAYREDPATWDYRALIGSLAAAVT